MGLEDFLNDNNVFYQQLESTANAKAKQILNFMFPHSMAESMNLWFGKSPQTDDYITKTFGKMVYEARDNKYDDWISNPIECLALIILLDQFPRNMFRHKVYNLIYTLLLIERNYSDMYCFFIIYICFI